MFFLIFLFKKKGNKKKGNRIFPMSSLEEKVISLDPAADICREVYVIYSESGSWLPVGTSDGNGGVLLCDKEGEPGSASSVLQTMISMMNGYDFTPTKRPPKPKQEGEFDLPNPRTSESIGKDEDKEDLLLLEAEKYKDFQIFYFILFSHKTEKTTIIAIGKLLNIPNPYSISEGGKESLAAKVGALVYIKKDHMITCIENMISKHLRDADISLPLIALQHLTMAKITRGHCCSTCKWFL
jgi:hypothetical protein